MRCNDTPTDARDADMHSHIHTVPHLERLQVGLSVRPTASVQTPARIRMRGTCSVLRLKEPLEVVAVEARAAEHNHLLLGQSQEGVWGVAMVEWRTSLEQQRAKQSRAKEIRLPT